MTGFDAASFIRDEIKRASTPYKLVSNLEQLLRLRLESELLWQKSKRSDLYRRTMEDGDVPLSVLLAGKENGSPVFYVCGFKTDGSILAEDRSSGEFTVWMGKANAIVRFFESNRKGPIFKSPEETVRTLIQLEIDDPSDNRAVGAPIDIVRITPKSTQWVQKKPECGENNK